MAPKRKSSTTALGTPFYQLGASASASKRRLFLGLENEIDNSERRDGYEYSYDSRYPTNAPNRSDISLSRTVSNTNNTHTSSGYRTPQQQQYQFDANTPITQLNNFLSATHVSSSSRRPSVQMTEVPLLAKTPPPPFIPDRPKTYLIVGASRGIGLEFARQLLLQHHQVIAVVRNPESASQLWQMTGSLNLRPGSCIIEQCDIGVSGDIDAFVGRMRMFVDRGGSIDNIVLNAGILDYEKGLGALDVSFEELERHLRVNCVGNVIMARKLVALNELGSLEIRRRQQLLVRSSEEDDRGTIVGRQVVFISSDSGSMADFREYEDGFATYGASKAALNMMLRHMAVELRRKGQSKVEELKTDWQSRNMMGDRGVKVWQHEICVLAMHPGEVSTDMANVELGWDVEGVITPEESVRDMLRVLEGRTSKDSGTFWRWDGKVSLLCVMIEVKYLRVYSNILGRME